MGLLPVHDTSLGEPVSDTTYPPDYDDDPTSINPLQSLTPLIIDVQPWEDLKIDLVAIS